MLYDYFNANAFFSILVHNIVVYQNLANFNIKDGIFKASNTRKEQSTRISLSKDIRAQSIFLEL